MTRNFTPMKHYAQAGLTLVELMIALAIGLLIGLVVFAAYTTGLGTQRAQSDMTRLEESARFGFDMVSRAVRRAGYRDTSSAYPAGYAGGHAQEFCTETPTGAEIVATNDATTVDLGGGVTEAVANRSDTIRVRYYGQDTPAHDAADGVILDCLGNAVRRGTLVQDTIYVAADPANNNEPTLYCATDNPAIPAGQPRNLPLVPGVESLQLLYAEDTDGDTMANRYLPANKVGSWNDVRGALVSVVVRTPAATGTDRSAKTFAHFGADYDAAANSDDASEFTGATDGRIRVQISNYVALRNFPVCF